MIIQVLSMARGSELDLDNYFPGGFGGWSTLNSKEL